jgi:hypothetical protein
MPVSASFAPYLMQFCSKEAQQKCCSMCLYVCFDSKRVHYNKLSTSGPRAGWYCRHTAAIGSPFVPMPSAAANSTDHEQIAALLSLGRMAVLVMQTHNKEAVAGVAAVVVSHVTEVCSAPLHVPNSTLVKLLECSMMDK